MGGFVGYAGASTGALNFTNCSVSGTICGFQKLGGFVGHSRLMPVVMTDCISYATVSGNNYVSGFVGYMLLGLWFRRFAPVLSIKKALAFAAPLWLAGAAIIGCGFFFRIGGSYPYSAPYAKAVDLEMSI